MWGPFFLALYLWVLLGFSRLVTTSERRMSQTITWDCDTRYRQWGAGLVTADSGGDRDRSPSQVRQPPDPGLVANLCARRWEIARSGDRQIERPQGIVKCNCCQWCDLDLQMAREGTARPDKQSVHKSSPRTLISDQRSLISNPAIVERRSVISEKREWSRRSELGLLFADALIDGVLIVNQMRATHTIFHCTCTSIDRWSPDLYDNLSQHWHLHSCASWVTDWPAWLADWLLDRSRRVPGSATPEWCKPVTLTYVLVLSPIWRSLSLSPSLWLWPIWHYAKWRWPFACQSIDKCCQLWATHGHVDRD